MNERKLYYDLINVELTEDYPKLVERTACYLRDMIKQNRDIVQYFEYSEEALDKFLLADYQETQLKYAKYVADNPPPRSREDMITYLTQLTPAKYVDGAWVQGAAKAYNIALDGDSLHSKVVNSLFNIYAEELGEGELEMNHIAIWKNLLANLGIEMPDPASHAFAFKENLWDSSFTVGTIQLALGVLTSSFFPEVLGYNMGFEQLPLHLLTTVDELRELEIDPYYFQLHISIDNLASGHGAMAVQAVKFYMDDVRTRFGDAVAATHWRRILDGFYLNFISPMKPELQRFYEAKHQDNLEEKVIKMFLQKAPFAHQLHGTRELGGCLLNKWLDPAATDAQMREFLEVLSTSHWVNPENPSASKFLTDLCGFGGPMFHIFTREEQKLITDWIQSLLPTTPVSPPPQLGNSETMKSQPEATLSTDNLQTAHAVADLMTRKAERAKRAHGNRTMANAKGESKKINEWFEGSVWELLDSLRHTYSLDKVTSNRGNLSADAAVDANPFVKSIIKGGMSKYFDTEEVEVVRKWILSGAPLPSKRQTTNPSSHSTYVTQLPTTLPSPLPSPLPSTPPTSTIKLSEPNKQSIKPTPLEVTEISGCPFMAKNNQFVKLQNFDSLFFQLANVEAYPKAFDEAKQFLALRLSCDSTLNECPPELELHNEICLQKLSNMIFSCNSLSQLNMIAKHAAIFFFMEGICLQNVNMAGFHHTYSSSVLMKIFMNIWGYEKPLANHHHFYNNLLKLLRVYLPPLNSSFISKCGFTTPASEFAVLQLSLSLFPRSYFVEMLAVLEWNLIMNKMILEDLCKKIQTFGAFAADHKSTQERITEYINNVELCREVIKLQADDARMQGDHAQHMVRLGKTRHLCSQLTNDFVLQLEREMNQNEIAGSGNA